MSLVSAGLAVGVFSVIGLSSPISGVASDRFGEISVILLSFTVLVPSFFGLAIAGNIILVYVLVILVRMFNLFLMSPEFALIPKLYDSEVAGRGTAIQNTFCFIRGSGFSNLFRIFQRLLRVLQLRMDSSSDLERGRNRLNSATGPIELDV
jgi:MFS family permease